MCEKEFILLLKENALTHSLSQSCSQLHNGIKEVLCHPFEKGAVDE